MLESYYRPQPKPETVSEFKDRLQSIWFALSEKASDNAVKNYTSRDCRRVFQPTVDILII